MKFTKLAMLILIAGMLISTGIAVAETKLDKWEGFRGIKWATNIKDVNDMRLVDPSSTSAIKVYSRNGDKLSIGKAKLKYIFYGAYKNKICSVGVISNGYSNFQYLKEAVFTYYGEGYQDNEYIEEWMWGYNRTDGKVTMILKYNEFSEDTGFYIKYSPIFQEKEEDDAKAAEDADDDF